MPTFLEKNQIYGIIAALRNLEPERERSERKLSLTDFLKTYNEDLPEQFTQATIPLLRKFQEDSPSLFKDGDVWSLDKHRKQFMEWVRHYMRSLRLATQS